MQLPLTTSWICTDLLPNPLTPLQTNIPESSISTNFIFRTLRLVLNLCQVLGPINRSSWNRKLRMTFEKSIKSQNYLHYTLLNHSKLFVNNMYLIPLDNWPWSTNNRTYKFNGVSFLGNIPLKISCGYFRRALNEKDDRYIVKEKTCSWFEWKFRQHFMLDILCHISFKSKSLLW